ncbi:Dynamin-related protein 5A [Sesamum angolense]|uniref:Dynamin-related protein 5A n=1 Tax=Sesamum angolense TaxID=2727404 RepID=A0AAE2BUN4_9LAMI|nr:Dynamin-related protein 5A [Sesamum angolense]
MDTSNKSASEFKKRFEAYNRLQAAAVAFGEKVPIPEIVALGGQSDGKSSLLEALLGFRFNVREVEMGTRRPLILQMVHDSTALEPRCRFQEEDSEEYGSPIVSSTAIADTIKSRTEALLRKTRTAVSSTPIIMRAEYAHCPNLTIIDTPGFVLKARKGEPSSVEWCSSLWLDAIREIDPAFRRTIIVVSNLITVLRQISQVDSEVMCYLRDGVKGGFDEEKYKSYIGFGCLRDHLESELQKKYKEATPATLAILEQRCSEVTADLARMETKIKATSDVAHLRRSAMLNAASLCNHLEALLDGAANPAPEQWGRTTEEEKLESGVGGWPGVTIDTKPPNATLRLYGGAAFERVVHEFRCATYSMECPVVSREKVANILLAHTGRGGSRGLTEAAAEIARAAARSWLAPLLDTACDRLAFVLRNLFDIAIERNRRRHSGFKKELGNCVEVGARKRQARITGNSRNMEHFRIHHGGSLLFGDGDTASRSGSTYTEICSTAAEHFARIREVLVERGVASTLNSAFLTPCREQLMIALGLELFAVTDEKFMDMFVAPGAIDVLQNEMQSLQKRQKILHSCLNDFKNVARAL